MITFPILKPDAGIKLDFPEQFLSKNFSSPYSRNIEYVNGKLQSRLGLEKLDTAALPDDVLVSAQYWKDLNTWFLMFATRRDIAYYDFTNTRFVYLTPMYTTGTIEVKTGELDKVYGSGTSWSGTLKAGDFIKIGAGNYYSSSTWYEIASVDSDTLLTLTSNAPITAASTAYAARQTFSGADTALWDETTFEDTAKGTIWIATNGYDTPIYWAGTGQVTALTGLPTGFTAARYVNVFKDRVFFFWCTVSGENCPKLGYWSGIADCEDWTDTDFRLFVEGEDWITGSVVFSNYLIVFKEFKAYVGRWVGGDYTFDFDISTQCIGCYAGHSIIVAEGGVFYYGYDNKFHFFNIIEDMSISDEILEYTKDFNPNLEGNICGDAWEWKNQFRWMVPYGETSVMNAVVVFDYVERIWQIWEYSAANALSCLGSYVSVSQAYVDDTAWASKYIDEETGYWDARQFLAGAPIMIYGGADGYIRKADVGNDDDGSDFTRTFRTKRLDFKRPHIYKRLQKQQWWFEKATAGTVTLKLKKDDNTDYDALTHSIDITSDTKDIVKKNATWNREAASFQFELTATNFFALLGFINTLFEKRSAA